MLLVTGEQGHMDVDNTADTLHLLLHMRKTRSLQENEQSLLLDVYCRYYIKHPCNRGQHRSRPDVQ